MHTRQDRPVPVAVPLATVQRLVAGALGWDALNSLLSFTLHRGAIEAEAYAVDQNGHRFAIDDEIAIDRIYIRVV